MKLLHVQHSNFLVLNVIVFFFVGLDQENGQIAVTSEGGLFQLRNLKISVSIARRAIDTKQHLSIRKIIPSQVSGVLKDITAGDIICMEPVGMKLRKHALVRFPISDIGRNMKLLCKSDIESESCQWLCVPQEKMDDEKHTDSIFWFFNAGYCNVFTLHNTTMCLVDDQEDIYTQMYHDKVMMADMSAKFIEFDKQLEVCDI